MTALEAFKNSNMWDPRFNLPLSPQNNNPWFYLACAAKIIKEYDQTDIWTNNERVLAQIKACEKEPGLFTRWPNGSPDDVTSHDELMGISYLSPEAASRILGYLAAHDGEYNNTALPDPIGQWNLYRLYWFIQFVKACAGIQLSLLSQFQWSILIIWDLLTTKANTDDAGGRLRIWLMSEAMSKFHLSGIFVAVWKWRMNKLGITPKAMLAKEPKENPVMAEFGQLSF